MKWQVLEEYQLVRGKCPDSGQVLHAELDEWHRRVLVCSICDCLGYPLVANDISWEWYDTTDILDMKEQA
jgi:hypothetical protein